ncbi:MAG: hypothetical protein RLZZ76_747 [Candidatus Parcubacteria bacterium]|jgi:hypothetical protein
MWDLVTLMAGLFHSVHNPTRSTPTRVGPKGPRHSVRILHPLATAKAANVFTFAACRLRTMLYDVRTSFMNERAWVKFPDYSNI